MCQLVRIGSGCLCAALGCRHPGAKPYLEVPLPPRAESSLLSEGSVHWGERRNCWSGLQAADYQVYSLAQAFSGQWQLRTEPLAARGRDDQKWELDP